MPAAAYAALINESLEIVSAHGDPAPAVYDLLFARNPEMKRLFWRDTDGAIRGNMLSMTLQTLLDFIEKQSFAIGMLQSEIVNHEGFGISPHVFATFFPTMRDAFREIAGAEWTPEIDAAWTTALSDMTRVLRAAAPALGD